VLLERVRACVPLLIVVMWVQVLLGIIIDSVWPPGQSAESCAKGALAKYMVESQAHVVQECLLDTDAEITVPGPTAGALHLAHMYQLC
jgi:competence protein ComGC